jgi:hypothetical protein
LEILSPAKNHASPWATFTFYPIVENESYCMKRKEDHAWRREIVLHFIDLSPASGE